MGLSRHVAGSRPSIRSGAAIFTLVLLMAAAAPAAAAVYQLDYGQATGTVRSLSVSLGNGTAGSTTLSTVASNAASTTIIAGLEFYVDANPTASCTTPSTDTSLSAPSSSGSYTLTRGGTVCLWSVQFTSSSSIPALYWVTDLWLDAGATGYGLTVSIHVTDSAGTQVGTVLGSGTTSNVPTTENETKDSFLGAAVTIPASGYIVVQLSAPTGHSAPHSFDIYWGSGQLSNFQTPSQYDYVLAVNNGATSTWTLSLGTLSTMTSNLGRLANVTVWFVSPFSKQIVVSSGSVSTNMGSGITLPASGTVDIAVAAYADAIPAGGNVPSTITMSLKVDSTSTPSVFAQYTVQLTID